MFLKDDLVKILFCPVNPHWVNEDAKLVELRPDAGIPQYTYYDDNGNRRDFYPTAYERKNAFWLVEVCTGAQSLAFVGHKIEPGDDALIVKAPLGWKELDGRIKPVEGVDAQRCIQVRSAKGLAVTVEDYRPIKIMTKEPVVEGISKAEVAQAVVDAFSVSGTMLDDKGYRLLDKLGIDLADDVEVTMPANIRLNLSVDVNYPKGIEVGDSAAIATSLAKKIKAMSTSELEDYLIRGLKTDLVRDLC